MTRAPVPKVMSMRARMPSIVDAEAANANGRPKAAVACSVVMRGA
jgi:hypothetical protein